MLSLLTEKYELPVQATIKLLQYMKVKVANTTVNETIQNHPDYPSLLSISDSLNKWQVENIAINITEDMLEEIPKPFITFTKRNSGEFYTVTALNENIITYIDSDGKAQTMTKGDFFKNSTGVVLLAEANETSGEKDFAVNRRKENLQQLKIPGIIGLGVLFSAIAIISFSANSFVEVIIGYSFLLLLKFCGIIVTSLLLWYEIDNANPVLQKICNGNAKINCNAVLNSKQSKLFSWLTWAEVGFYYFTGGVLALLSYGNHPAFAGAFLSTIAFLNILAFPFIIFSLYYQWRVAKQWCILCLAVLGVLFLEFIVALSANLIHLPVFHSTQLQTLSFSFTIPVIVWLFLKPALMKAEEEKRIRRELMRIKYNPQIFAALFAKQKQITQSPEGLGILIGNPAALNTVIKVCNPYCGPCSKAHPEIEKLIEEIPGIKARIIFTATNAQTDSTALPVKHLLALAALNNEAKTRKALGDWYLTEKKDYKLFAEKYPINDELEMQSEKIEAMDSWCKATGIIVTPTFFYNGVQFPEVYEIKDLKYFLME